MPFPTYTFAEFGGGQPAEMKLHRQVVAAGPYSTNFLGIVVNYNVVPQTCTIVFDVPPSVGNQTTVDGVVATHNGIEVPLAKEPLVLSVPFAALAPGVADDVIIYSTDAPYDFKILNAFVYVTTSIALATLQLRSALNNGGVALSDLWVATTVGIKVNIALPVSEPTVLAGRTLTLRRSDRGIAGEVVISLLRI